MLSALRQTLAGVACRRVTTSVAATAATTTTKRGVLTSNSSVVEVDNPYTGQVRTFPLNSIAEVNAAIARAADAQREWRHVPLAQRIEVCTRFMEVFNNNKLSIASDISWQMGKPLSQSTGEVAGTLQRLRAMIAMAPEALADDQLPPLSNGAILRSIKKEPIGVALVLAPWNYPLLTAANAVFPAILAGNAVVLKHSERTPSAATAFVSAFEEAGLPKHLMSSVLCTNDVTAQAIRNPRVGYVAFTGSVQGGRSVHKSVSDRFIDVGLELGGKDGAYVAPDANLSAAIETLVDGAFYNAGQSCCGIERIYVHKSLYQQFVDGAVELVKQYKLGDPFDAATTMGPVAQPTHCDFLRTQVQEARRLGARILCGGHSTTDAAGKGRFFAPTVVADATHNMSIMTEESFGPVVGIAPVGSDEEAIEMLNDSHYGLTGVVFTNDQARFAAMAPQIEAGTVFMNRCDYLDPELPWTGVKDTGKGVSLSRYGFRPYYRLKGYHVKVLSS